MNINTGAEAIHRGVVDGTFNAWAATAAFRMDRVVKTWIDEPLGVRPLMVVVAKRAYDGLPEKARKAMDKHSGLPFVMKNAEVLDELGAQLRKGARADPNANVIELPEAEAEKVAARFKPLIQEWIAKTPNGEKVYAALVEALADYRKTRR
jgi:TRAP-type C4-dicarboxylate transport system substrate-binding protein